MRKTTNSVSKLHFSCKGCNSQLIDCDSVWGKVSKLQPLYKNIKSYYYYREIRNYAATFFCNFGRFSAESLTGLELCRLQNLQLWLQNLQLWISISVKALLGLTIKSFKVFNGLNGGFYGPS